MKIVHKIIVALAGVAALFLWSLPPILATGDLTFNKDIAPLFFKNCAECHRPGETAPFSALTYKDVRPWAKSIRERVITRQMPPWHIDNTVGIQKFKNDRSLSDAQIDTIVKWVDAGAPKGELKDMPAPKQWPDESKWNFAGLYGPPDLVIKSPDWTVPPVGQDAWYKPVIPTGITEPRYVRAIEIRPASVKGRKVTHHALARLQQQEANAADSAADDALGVGKRFYADDPWGNRLEFTEPTS